MAGFGAPMIYLAAPLFTPQERLLNEGIAALLERRYKVFLPQRDGVLLPGSELDSVAFARMSLRAYEGDISAIRSCSCLLAILDGRAIDEGVAFELGFAVALGKPCYGLKTDTRVLLPMGDNPMIACALRKCFASVTEIEASVESCVFGLA